MQDPKQQAALMAAKFPGANVAVVMPSRLEACFACFDHFLGRVTATGEPLGHDGQVLRCQQPIGGPHPLIATTSGSCRWQGVHKMALCVHVGGDIDLLLCPRKVHHDDQ